MEAIRVRGGHRFRIKHGPAAEKSTLSAPKTVGLSPRGFSGLKPKLLVKEGEAVKRGQPLFRHKKRQQIVFTSPAGGVVKEIRFGPRRVLEAVVVELDEAKEEAIDFGAVSKEALGSLGREKIVEKLLASGLWSRFIAFPGWDIMPFPGEVLPSKGEHDHEPEPSPKLRAIYVSAFATEPHQPDAAVALEGNEELFKAGLEVLRQIPEKKTWLFSAKGQKKLPPEAIEVPGIQHRVIDERFPAENVGVQVYYTERLEKDERAVGLSVEDVLDIGHLFLKGTLRKERTYAVGGNAASAKKHFVARQGISVKDLAGELPEGKELRFIAGGLFTGQKVREDDYLGLLERALEVMEEDRRRIPFAFQFRLGADYLTLLRTWVGGFFPDAEREATTSNHGEERACVQCHACIDVCPVELMPNLLFKACLERDIEKMERLFIHDCADCGLCTFVCPSKIELGQHIEDGKAHIAKEG